MRYLFGFLCVCALGLMPLIGCGETTGSMPECESAEDCDDGNECTADTCTDGKCDSTPVADGTACGDDAGTCQQESCRVACDEQGIRDAIAAGGGPYTFGCDGPKTVVTAEEIVIDNDVILDGEGNLTVDGNDEHRVFSVSRGVMAALHGVAVNKGVATSCCAGGIDNRGTLTLTDSMVSGNEGGIHIIEGATLTMNNSTVLGNTAYEGGGIVNDGTLTMTNCTVRGNMVTGGGGGGIYNERILTLTDSAVLENQARALEDEFGIHGGNGGGISNSGTAALTNSTVSHNSAEQEGGGIFNFGTFTMTSSTVSGNTTDGIHFARGGPEDPLNFAITSSIIDGDCSMDDGLGLVSNGYNIESPGNTCGFDEAKGDQPGVTEMQLNLGPLADNGGPTQTHKPGDGGLGEGSAAIDQIPGDACDLTEDQRGEPRPETGGSMCDVGSVEVQP